jgi:hypothetical protein
MNRLIITAAAGLALMATTARAEQAKINGIVGEVFGSRFVLETASGKVLVELSPKGADKVTIKAGDKIDVEGDRRANQVRAQRVTLANGQAYTIAKKTRTWREFVTGTPAKPDVTAAFGNTEAKNIATKAGYTLATEPVSEKKHFAVEAVKDTKAFDLKIFRDGRIDAKPAFGVVQVKAAATAKGYVVTGEPVRLRDQFTMAATKNAKTVEIDVKRNGDIVERAPFGITEVKALVVKNGYEMIGDMRPVDNHFEVLGKKNGTFSELRVDREGQLKRTRAVEANDPRWGSLVR